MMELERKAFIDAYIELHKEIDHLICTQNIPPSKSHCLSKIARKNGNSLYISTLHDDIIHEEIFKFYCQSICTALIGSEELALAYGNRSAFLQHIARYKECIKDVDRALTINVASNALKVKLLCRKAACQDELGLSNNKNTLEEAKGWVNKMNNDKDKQSFLKLIDETESSLRSTKQNRRLEQDNEVSKASSLKEDANIFDSVDIQHNEKYGRHLVATRNFKPGEIIFLEKFYATVLNLNKSFTNCHNCLNFFWSGIPCDSCNWAMFCSEKCKDEAMKNYHDIECSIITILKVLCKRGIDYYHMSIRLLIMGIREAGSIEQLKTQLQSDEFANEEGKMRNSKFKDIYSLTSNTSDAIVKDQRKLLVLVLILLRKHSSIFGENFNYNKLKDLIKNDNFIFIGSLLYKLFKINAVNTYSLNQDNKVCKHSNDPAQCLANLCCDRGRAITHVASLINHSCIPNVRHCFTDDGKIIIFAIQPIKKDSQIFDCYNSTFYDSDYIDRQEYFETYNFICDCQACIEDWPAICKNALNFKEQTNPRIAMIVNEIFSNIQEVLTALDNGERNFNQKAIKKISKEIARATNCLPQPSSLICTLLDAIQDIITRVHGCKSQSFGHCQKFSDVHTQ